MSLFYKFDENMKVIDDGSNVRLLFAYHQPDFIYITAMWLDIIA